MTNADIEQRLRSAIDLLVDATEPAHPDRPPATFAPTPKWTTGPRPRRRPPAHPHPVRIGPRRAVLVAAALVVMSVATVALVGSRHSGPVVPRGPLHQRATATYPPIPASVAGASGCLGLAQVGMTTGQAQTIMAVVNMLAGGGQKVQGLGPCTGGPVLVALAPGQEALAHVLWARYGRDLSITVGLTAYHGSPGRSPRCGTLEPSSPLPAGVQVALRLKAQTVVPGAVLSGKVVVSDRGPARFFMDTGQPLEAVVVATGTRRVVGVYSGVIGGTGYGPRLGPGQSSTVPVVGGTARCDGGIGSALPPGRYQVLVRVAPETSPHTPSYLTPPVSLLVRTVSRTK